MSRILLRVSFNVPIKNGAVADDFKIRAHLPTIKSYLKQGAQVFLIAHQEKDGKILHLDGIYKSLQRHLKVKIKFLRGTIPKVAGKFSEKVVLFDNVRLNAGEKKNDLSFAKKLASHGDIYVNDAFADSHRMHASIVGVTKFLPSSMGMLMKAEVATLKQVFHPARPFLFVLGGKKFSTKEPLISKFLKTADTIFIGGALGNTFLAARGFSVGASKIESARIPKAILNSKKILLPEDVVVMRGRKKKVVRLSEISKRDVIYDAGPNTVKKLLNLAKESKFVLWNGTLGLCEEGFEFGTKTFAQRLSKSKAYKIAGGGDTVAALRKLKQEKNFDFVSTGGGAMLEFLATGTLPGIEALKKK